MNLAPFIPRWLSLSVLLLLHWALAVEERLTLYWQTGRWAARDWAQAAVEWVPVPAWAPAWVAARGAPRRVGGAAGGGRGARPPPPTCAALILAEVTPGEMPVDRAAAVINWCAQAGITRLFAYDPTGFLKQHAAGLRAHLARSAELVLGFDGAVVEGGAPPIAAAAAAAAAATVVASPLSVVDTNAARRAGGAAAAAAALATLSGAAVAASTVTAAKAANGGGSGPPPAGPSPPPPPSIHVHLLSAGDAEETMAKAIAAVAAERGRGEEQAAPVPKPSTSGADAQAATAAAVSRLETALVTASGPAALAEPGVALVYGSAFTLAGYPPWALRAAEIYSMGRLRDAEWRGVRGALARYGATVQRFGA